MGHLPICFLECGDLPPAVLIPQQQTNLGVRGRGLVMPVSNRGDTKLQHLDTIRGGRVAIPMTVSGIHGNVILEQFLIVFLCIKTLRFQRKPCFRPE